MSQAAFAQIQQILESAVNGGTIGAHGNFWRNKTRDQFVTLKVFGRQLLVLGKADDSNLIKALRGQAPFDGSELPRMPVGLDPVPDKQIEVIRQWINDGCPDTAAPPPSEAK